MFKLFTQVIEAFKTLKELEIQHRDIKPDNFMVEFGQTDYYKVMI